MKEYSIILRIEEGKNKYSYYPSIGTVIATDPIQAAFQMGQKHCECDEILKPIEIWEIIEVTTAYSHESKGGKEE